MRTQHLVLGEQIRHRICESKDQDGQGGLRVFVFIGGVGPRKKRLEDRPRICAGCGLSRAYLVRVDNYLYLFFIPVFPIRRGEPFVECERCGHISDERGQVYAPGIDMQPRRCRRCGSTLQEDFRYCPYCGEGQ